jgi:hypothetical protein
MNNKIIAKIIELKEKSFQIPDSESLDDLKELEYFDFEIINLIYDYCLKQKYNIDGFPEKYFELIENEDEDFIDFLNFDTKYYYVLKNSLIHNDVFIILETYFNYPKNKNYNNVNCKKDILINIELLENENINLEFNRADYNHYQNLKKSRPKLP